MSLLCEYRCPRSNPSDRHRHRLLPQWCTSHALGLKYLQFVANIDWWIDTRTDVDKHTSARSCCLVIARDMIATAYCQRYITRLSSCFDCLLDDDGSWLRCCSMRKRWCKQHWQLAMEKECSNTTTPTRMPIPVRNVAPISKKNSCRQARSEGARVQFLYASKRIQ